MYFSLKVYKEFPFNALAEHWWRRLVEFNPQYILHWMIGLQNMVCAGDVLVDLGFFFNISACERVFSLCKWNKLAPLPTESWWQNWWHTWLAIPKKYTVEVRSMEDSDSLNNHRVYKTVWDIILSLFIWWNATIAQNDLFFCWFPNCFERKFGKFLESYELNW